MRRLSNAFPLGLWLVAGALTPLRGQMGDTAGEGPQVPLPAARKTAPAVVQSPAEELATFQLPPGFRIELVAAEPLVHDPVAAAYDHQGNLWVAEMTRFNAGLIQDIPPLAGGAAVVPPGKIVKLESSRHDGHYDRRTVWLDDLNNPRAIAIMHDGILVADPPNLWLARDAHGSGKCDEKKLVAGDYGVPGSEEGSANGLLWGRDNILHNISYEYDYRYAHGTVEKWPILVRGQFGLAQDDFGRLFFSRNSDQLRSDLYAPRYNVRNPHLTDLPWANVRIALDQIVWPSHPTPAVNRGYRRGVAGQQTGGLRDDATLLEFTAACSAQLYRGANFPARFYGNAFVPEPGANLVHRDVLLESEGRIVAADAYEGREFLTSTDSRFRPVALVNAPDGSFLVVDFYRGILEEYHLITSYLRDQTLARGLQEPMFGHGRLWRITYEGGALNRTTPDLDRMSATALSALLAEPNAWWRDTAQQEIVERGDRSAVPALTELARRAPAEATRAYALWTLDGLDATTPDLLAPALADPSPKVRAAAVRLHERWLRAADAEPLVARLARLIDDPAPEVAVQLALTLGEAASPAAGEAQYRLLLAAGDHPYLPKAIASGLRGREFEFFQRLAADCATLGPRPEIQSMLTVLASTIVHEGEPRVTGELIARASDAGRLPKWARLAVLGGFDPLTRPAFRRTMGRTRVVKAAALAPLMASADADIKSGASRLADRLARIEEQDRRRVVAAPLAGDDLARYEAGKVTYQICSACHQLNGAGLTNVAPSLVDSHWVDGNPEILIRIVLNGKEGTPGFPGAMPAIGTAFNDEQIAGVLTYIRNSWGLQAGPVSPALVASVRRELGPRQAAWTDEALQRLDLALTRRGAAAQPAPTP